MLKPIPSSDHAPAGPLHDAGSDDALYTSYVRDKIQAGLDSLGRGRGVPHDEARQRMAKWLDD